MKFRLLTAISAVAMMAAAPALAETKVEPYNKASSNAPATTTGQSAPSTPSTTGENIEQGWEKTKEAATDAATKASDAVTGAENIHAAVVDEDATATAKTYIDIAGASTATGILGKEIQNTAGKKIGQVEDIILDRDGNAQMVLISHGGFLGLGDKLAAFDYGLVTRREADGDVIMPLAEETVKKAAPFSYTKAETDPAVRMMPEGGASVKKLLDAKVVNPAGDVLAEVDNISLRESKADKVIASFDQTMGVGGEKVALNYNRMQLASLEDGSYRFQLTDAQAAKLDTFKKSYSN